MNPDVAGKTLASVKPERFTDHTLIPGLDLTADLEKTARAVGRMTTKSGMKACPVSGPPSTTTAPNPVPEYLCLAHLFAFTRTRPRS